ncbi:GNAT family N-acetyltransferase [Formicincola oecophyllae]|nr:N-acetyltransferase [Formicincola oecophyllae]
MDFQSANPAHVAILEALHQACFPPKEAWSAAFFKGQLALPGTQGWVGLVPGPAREGEPIGLCLVRSQPGFGSEPGECEILTLGIVPAWRSRGHGGKLLAHALKEPMRRRERILLEVEADNLPAKTLYHHMGFREVALRPGYYGQGRDALLMACQPGT